MSCVTCAVKYTKSYKHCFIFMFKVANTGRQNTTNLAFKIYIKISIGR